MKKLAALTIFSLALAGTNTTAAVIQPSAVTGSELVFEVGLFDNWNFGYTKDLGITLGDFLATQNTSQSWALGPKFAGIFNQTLYDTYLPGETAPNKSSGSWVVPGYASLSWQVFGAQSGATNRVLTTWGKALGSTGVSANKPQGPFANADVINTADTLNTYFGPAFAGTPPQFASTMNERAGHAGATDGDDFITADEWFINGNTNGTPQAYNGLMQLQDPPFKAVDQGLDDGSGDPLLGGPTLTDVVPAYLFTAGAGTNVNPNTGLAALPGTWRIDLDNRWLQYCVNGQCVAPAAVPVPAAVWLFGSALLGIAGMGRRRGA